MKKRGENRRRCSQVSLMMKKERLEVVAWLAGESRGFDVMNAASEKDCSLLAGVPPDATSTRATP